MKPTTIALLQKCKQEKKRFATITAYDYSFAKLFADEGINVMLVGDSLGMTVQGHDSTLPVTVEDIAYHTRAVRRGAPNCLLLADLPFMAYATPEQTFENAAIVMRAGANMVKIEGGAWAGGHRENACRARGAGVRAPRSDAPVGERLRRL
ncbi:3-methyl-2-oxobutanoate hydroxymethyltransferase [Klebsiella michiganensis]|nr:3-methyl-2-oxobutanoate hydroxymethyltransferase [Klebsiella michiganensis]